MIRSVTFAGSTAASGSIFSTVAMIASLSGKSAPMVVNGNSSGTCASAFSSPSRFRMYTKNRLRASASARAVSRAVRASTHSVSTSPSSRYSNTQYGMTPPNSRAICFPSALGSCPTNPRMNSAIFSGDSPGL